MGHWVWESEDNELSIKADFFLFFDYTLRCLPHLIIKSHIAAPNQMPPHPALKALCASFQ